MSPERRPVSFWFVLLHRSLEWGTLAEMINSFGGLIDANFPCFHNIALFKFV